MGGACERVSALRRDRPRIHIVEAVVSIAEPQPPAARELVHVHRSKMEDLIARARACLLHASTLFEQAPATSNRSGVSLRPDI